MNRMMKYMGPLSLALAGAACQGLAEAPESVSEEMVALGTSKKSMAAARSSQGARLAERRNAEGEVLPVLLPLAQPTTEVGPGSECGLITPEGTVLQCGPSHVCQRHTESAPARCVEAPRPPRQDG